LVGSAGIVTFCKRLLNAGEGQARSFGFMVDRGSNDSVLIASPFSS
jgi:hypothetical protein